MSGSHARVLALIFLSSWTACGDDGKATPKGSDAGSDAGSILDDDPSMPSSVVVPSNDPGAPDMLDLTVHSAAMGRDVSVRLLVPASFQTQPSRHYPVLYLLIGANEPLGYRAWTEQSNVETLAAAHDLLVVMPEAGSAGWYSDWIEPCSPGSTTPDNQPAWETFHTVELPRVLEKFYRANGQNAIAGLSMGGLGATSYAARHPGMFKAVASYSGALHSSTYSIVEQISLTEAGCSNVNAVWGDVTAQPAVWAAHDPFELADKLVDLPVYVSCGDGTPGPLDPPTVTTNDPLEAVAQSANQDFVTKLGPLSKSNLMVHLYGPGTHSWPYWSRELGLSFAMLVAPLSAD